MFFDFLRTTEKTIPIKFFVKKDTTTSNMDFAICHESLAGQSKGSYLLIAVTKEEALQLATALLQAHQDLLQEDK